MDANNFDQFSRAIGRGFSRRGLLALLAGAAGLRTRDALAAQLAPPACGQAGAVCTMLSGCCAGFTCVTSTINVNYGVCTTGGEGGTVAGTTSLISPFSDGAAEQVAGAATDTSTTSTTDPQAEREARIAEHKARKDAHRSKIKSRKNQQQTRRETKKDDRVLDRSPRLDFAFDPALNPGESETVQVNNDMNRSVFISKVSRLNDPGDASFPNITLGISQTFSFISGIPLDSAVNSNQFVWRDTYVCGDPTDGIVITAGQASDSVNHEFTVLCDGTLPESSGSHHRHKKNQNRKHAKKRQQHKAKAKKGKKHKRG